MEYIHCGSPGAPQASSCFHTGPANALEEASGGNIELPRASKDSVFKSPFVASAPVGVDEVAKAYGYLQHEVLSMGDVKDFHFEVPGGILSNASPDATCPNIWRPHPHVMSFIDGILDTLLGSNYAAVYWKR